MNRHLETLMSVGLQHLMDEYDTRVSYEGNGDFPACERARARARIRSCENAYHEYLNNKKRKTTRTPKKSQVGCIECGEPLTGETLTSSYCGSLHEACESAHHEHCEVCAA
jgi:hypothetical protein